MSVTEKQEEYCRLFRQLSDGDSQLDYLFSRGLDPPAEDLCRPEHRLAGCKTAIWLVVSWEEDRATFEAASDSLLVNGVLSIYRELYYGRRREEIRGNPPDFLSRISDQVIYPDIKRGGLWKCYERLAA